MVFNQDFWKNVKALLKLRTILKVVVFLCIALGGWFCLALLCTDYSKSASSISSIKEEWFEANITDFQLSFIANKYIVLRKTTVHGHGDFACSSSVKRGMCAFKIKTLTQAAKICNTYADVCKAFVLTKDMSIRLVHQVKRPTYDSQAALFVKREHLNNQELASH